jgi:hypothetical protein
MARKVLCYSLAGDLGGGHQILYGQLRGAPCCSFLSETKSAIRGPSPMTKKPPKLAVVRDAPVDDLTAPPPDLGETGAHLWSSIQAQYVISDAGGLAGGRRLVMPPTGPRVAESVSTRMARLFLDRRGDNECRRTAAAASKNGWTC